MFGDTIDIFYGGSGGTQMTLKKINQDNYSAEYLRRTDATEQRLKIRHSVESPITGYVSPLERHNAELTVIDFANGTTLLEDQKRVISLTIRTPATATQSSDEDWADALVNWATQTVVGQLSNWES